MSRTRIEIRFELVKVGEMFYPTQIDEFGIRRTATPADETVWCNSKVWVNTPRLCY
jgi:hypothetical protein